MNHDEELALAVEWFKSISQERQIKAVEALLDHAIRSDWVGVWSIENRSELSQESGKPIECYTAPYFRTCGEPIA